jgi:diacylglycerol O-acyltransferase
MHMSHALTDGVGGVELFAQLYDFEPEPPRAVTVPPVPEGLSPNELLRQRLSQMPRSFLVGVGAAAAGFSRGIGAVMCHARK